MYIQNEKTHRYVFASPDVAGRKELARASYSPRESEIGWHEAYDEAGPTIMFVIMVASAIIGGITTSDGHIYPPIIAFTVTALCMLYFLNAVNILFRPLQQRRAIKSLDDRSVSVPVQSKFGYEHGKGNSYALQALLQTSYGNKLWKLIFEDNAIGSKKQLKKLLKGNADQAGLASRIMPVLDEYLQATTQLDEIHSRNIEKASPEKLDELRARIDEYAQRYAQIMHDMDEAHKEELEYKKHQVAEAANFEIEQATIAADIEVEAAAQLELPPVRETA